MIWTILYAFGAIVAYRIFKTNNKIEDKGLIWKSVFWPITLVCVLWAVFFGK